MNIRCGLLAVIVTALAGSAQAAMLDLTQAVVVVPQEQSARNVKAVQILVDEIAARTRITLPITREKVAVDRPAIVVGLKSQFGDRAKDDPLQKSNQKAEGFSIRSFDKGRPTALVLGNDDRGVMYGVGRLLREMRLSRDRILLPDNLAIDTAPQTPLRGHQLGYRPKTNSYDGWTVAMWDQYIRDLIVFGVNAVELIPPRSDDDDQSPHFPLPKMQMMIEMSRLLDSYDLDVWIWYPAMDADYADPATVEFALKEWGEVFSKVPRIDSIFIPGGDPGHTQPKYLMPMLERQAKELRRYHPQAEMWVAPQSFNDEWLGEFLEIVNSQQPKWLNGIVFGPQVRIPLPELRKAIPQQYPIRRYPDITHSRQCQYPVPSWDVAFSITEARETINPRPRGQATIFRLLDEYSVGFITYSEGCNDDVNKAVWSGLGWNADTPVIDILRQYSRYFIGPEYSDSFAQGLLDLEQNWKGPLLTNTGVETTLLRFQDMERTASPQMKANWRFQQALYRAYYDAFIHSRLIYETRLEEQAMQRLRLAKQLGAKRVMAEAESILNKAVNEPVASELRLRVFSLAEALFQSIRMQLSVEKYQAINVGRGANLDTIDLPLNNRVWLTNHFAQLREETEESKRLAGIDRIVNWTNPGPGGYYDDLGDVANQPHLELGLGFERDPAFFQTPIMGLAARSFRFLDYRRSWWNNAEAMHDEPLKMRYRTLDPTAQYKVRVVYAGDTLDPKIRLMADNKIEIHPDLAKGHPFKIHEFDIPHTATRDGDLTLSWYRQRGLGGNGRGCQVAEVWLIRK